MQATAGDTTPPRHGDGELPALRPPSPREESGPSDAADVELKTERVSEAPSPQSTDRPTPREPEEVPASFPTLSRPSDSAPRPSSSGSESKPRLGFRFKTLNRRFSNSMRQLHPEVSSFASSSTPVVSLQRNKTLGQLHKDKVLTRLGVTSETMRLEKGMKKLGICDHDIEASIEIRRHCGVVLSEPVTKEELLLGFSGEQLKRIKAVKTMGTTENEILDVYCKQISNLGIPQAALR